MAMNIHAQRLKKEIHTAAEAGTHMPSFQQIYLTRARTSDLLKTVITTLE